MKIYNINDNVCSACKNKFKELDLRPVKGLLGEDRYRICDECAEEALQPVYRAYIRECADTRAYRLAVEVRTAAIKMKYERKRNKKWWQFWI